MSYPTDRPTQAPDGVPARILAVQSSLGLWDGSGWVKTWGEALTYPTGRDCVLAAEVVARETGVNAMMAYTEMAAVPSGF